MATSFSTVHFELFCKVRIFNWPIRKQTRGHR